MVFTHHMQYNSAAIKLEKQTVSKFNKTYDLQEEKDHHFCAPRQLTFLCTMTATSWSQNNPCHHCLKVGSSVTKTTFISCCICSIQIGLTSHTSSKCALQQGLRPSHTVHQFWRRGAQASRLQTVQVMWRSGHLAHRMLQTAQGSFVFRIRLRCTEASMLALVPAQFCILIISVFGHMECTPSIAACVRSTSNEN